MLLFFNGFLFVCLFVLFLFVGCFFLGGGFIIMSPTGNPHMVFCNHVFTASKHGCFVIVSVAGNHWVVCNRVFHSNHGCFVIVSATGSMGVS